MAEVEGVYKALVKDANGCAVFTNEITVERGALPTVSIQVIDELNISAVTNESGTYQWLLNGLPVNGANVSTLKITAAGSYTVAFTNDAGCTTISDPVSVTGDEDDWLAEITTVFPNPTSGKVRLEFTESLREDFTVRVFDASGRMVSAKDYLVGQAVMLDLSQQATGLYYIEIIAGEARAMKKVSKQ